MLFLLFIMPEDATNDLPEVSLMLLLGHSDTKGHWKKQFILARIRNNQ